jgi:hypothetical protein
MIPLYDSDDIEVLMHRDAHFGGSFPIMLDYYEKGGKGALLEHERIRRIAALPETYPLSEADQARVDESLAMYHNLRKIYELEEEKNPIPRLVSDLILSENEEEESAIAALKQAGDATVPFLINLLHTPNLADPLFPGYGFAIGLACRCLSHPDAIPALFETVGHEDNFTDEEATSALLRIGAPARAFCLRLLLHDQITNDTEKAAHILSLFPPDPEIAAVATSLLKQNPPEPLASYLRLCIS